MTVPATVVVVVVAVVAFLVWTVALASFPRVVSCRVRVGGRLVGDTFWFVAGTARETDYVRNIEREACVRVRAHGRLREGVATLCPEDDARRRLWRLNPVNALFLRVTGFELLTVRVDPIEPA